MQISLRIHKDSHNDRPTDELLVRRHDGNDTLVMLQIGGTNRSVYVKIDELRRALTAIEG